MRGHVVWPRATPGNRFLTRTIITSSVTTPPYRAPWSLSFRAQREILRGRRFLSRFLSLRGASLLRNDKNGHDLAVREIFERARELDRATFAPAEIAWSASGRLNDKSTAGCHCERSEAISRYTSRRPMRARSAVMLCGSRIIS